MLASFLRKCLVPHKHKAKDVDTAVSIINQSCGNIRIKDLQKHCKMSERTLERSFKEQLGVSPKEYARLIRFKSTLQHLLAHPDTNLAALAYNFGYADQSHLNKDFQHFVAANPEKVLEDKSGVEELLMNRKF
jgi:transcriptional regulator GlxA family with amidase domain